MENKTKFQYIVMILCFIYAGISVILLIYQTSMIIGRDREPLQNFSFQPFMRNETTDAAPRFNGIRRSPFQPIELIASSSGLAISLIAGFSIMDLLKKKEKKELTKSVIDTMLTPEEKKVIQLLEDNDDELTQSELVSQTKLSKVKISRVIKRLESLKVISKYPYGMTNKIKLEKKIYEK